MSLKTSFFSANRIHWQFEVGEKNSKKDCFRLNIYLRMNNILIHNFLYMFDKRGEI